MVDLAHLLKKYKRELYNDIVVDGKVVVKGVRESCSRLDTIDAVIPPNATVIDIGCHLGFFTIQLASRKKDRLVVGMEGNYQRAELAGAIAEANRLENVIIINNLITDQMALRWGNCCEAFNSILLLNVLHHCRIDQIPGIIKGVGMLAPQLIIETPTVNESTACGSNDLHEMVELMEVDGYEKKIIAKTKSHTGGERKKNRELKRPMYSFYNRTWTKEVDRPHFNHSTPSKHRHKIDFINNQFVHKKKVWDTGVNLGTMVALNMVFPHKSRVFEMIEKTLNAHQGPLRDINLWNMIYTPNGINLIDFDDWLEEKCDRDKILMKLEKQFDQLKKEGARPLQVQNFINWVKHVIVGLSGKYRR